MTRIDRSGTFSLGDRTVRRLGSRERLHHHRAAPGQQRRRDVTGTGQVVGHDADRVRVHDREHQPSSTARAGAPSSPGNLSGRQTRT